MNKIMNVKQVRIVDSKEEEVIQIEKKNTVNFQCVNQAIYTDFEHTKDAIAVRINGELRNIGLWLNPDYNWQIVKDEVGELILLPTLKD